MTITRRGLILTAGAAVAELTLQHGVLRHGRRARHLGMDKIDAYEKGIKAERAAGESLPSTPINGWIGAGAFTKPPQPR